MLHMRAASLEGYRRTAGGSHRETLLETEQAWLAAVKPDLVVSDIVPLACAAAAAVGIPCVCISNFSWGAGPFTFSLGKTICSRPDVHDQHSTRSSYVSLQALTFALHSLHRCWHPGMATTEWDLERCLVSTQMQMRAQQYAERSDCPGAKLQWQASLKDDALSCADFVYSEYLISGQAGCSGYRAMIYQIAEDYACADLILRLPGHAPMPAFREVEDVPLVVRHARRSRAQVNPILFPAFILSA